MRRSKMIEMTREEFHTLIWNTPLTRLLKEYDLTEQTLENICIRFNIPNPYTTSKFFTPTNPPPLSEFKHPIFRTISLHKILYPYIEEEVLPDKFKSLLEAENDPAHRIIVPATLSNPHPLVTKTNNLLIKSSRCKGRYLETPFPNHNGCLYMVVTQLTIDRALRIMDSLIKALEKRGFQIIVEPSEITYLTHVVILGEKIPIKIEEIESGTPGRLALWFWKIWGEGIDTDTRDIRQHRLEGMLNSFLCKLIDTAGRQWIIHQQEHQKEQELQEIENCRLTKERKHKEEQERVDALVKEANLYDSCQKIRAYVLAVQKSSIDNAGQIPQNSPFAEWIKWASQLADFNDPVRRRIEQLQNCLTTE